MANQFKRSEIRKIIGDACTEQMETALVALHLSVIDPLKDDLQKAEDKVKDYDAIKKERDDLKAEVERLETQCERMARKLNEMGCEVVFEPVREVPDGDQ